MEFKEQKHSYDHLPFDLRLVSLIGDKMGLTRLVNKYEIDKRLDRLVENNLKLLEILGSGYTGFSLGKFLYSENPEEKGSALVSFAGAAFVTMCVGVVDYTIHRKRQGRL